MLQIEILLDVVGTSRISFRSFIVLLLKDNRDGIRVVRILPCGDGSAGKDDQEGYYVVPYGELNGIPVAFMARFRVVSKSRDCKNPPNVNTGANQRVCFECGAQGNFKKDCPKLKNNNNQDNWVGNAKAQAKVYAMGNAGANPDNNVIMDLMPIELDSFDVIIGMDWWAKYHAVIVCTEKIVRVPFSEMKFLIVETKTSQRGKNDLKMVPVVQEFPKVFPEDLPGIPPTRQVEFQIDLVPGATPVARAPYRLAPSEMKELAEQL
ncbi:putative reverse transcriptase domain-containing protein [Tanacetum coccineum]